MSIGLSNNNNKAVGLVVVVAVVVVSSRRTIEEYTIDRFKIAIKPIELTPHGQPCWEPWTWLSHPRKALGGTVLPGPLHRTSRSVGMSSKPKMNLRLMECWGQLAGSEGLRDTSQSDAIWYEDLSEESVERRNAGRLSGRGSSPRRQTMQETFRVANGTIGSSTSSVPDQSLIPFLIHPARRNMLNSKVIFDR